VSEELCFLFGVHDHQPAENFEDVIKDAVARAYHPFLQSVLDVPGVPVTVHCSGALLGFLREAAPGTFDLLGTLVAQGRVELLTGGFHEPILSMLPDWDKVGQIQALTDFLRSSFGVRPRGMWLAERVWEPHLPRVLREAGVEFVLLDDAHFALAGLEPEALGGYYLTEEQGATLAVFPISQRLRYLVPFADPEETVRYLDGRRAAGAVTLVDDGEKFGLWPGTDRLVYGERWLARFLDALGGTSWIRLSTFSRYLDAAPPAGRVYLPSASYREMGDWALPAAAAAELEEARRQLGRLPEGERIARLLRGGFWRNFLTKYPEVADCYWKMLRLSRRLREALEARPDDPRLLAARERLWRGQANDAYWHGVFGGCYLPHLRRGVKSALIGCERLLGAAEGAPALEWRLGDINGDGRPELAVRTPALSLVVQPERGGTLTELAFLPRELDAGDVLTRRPEAYHARVTDRTGEGGRGAAKTIHGEALPREAGLAGLLAYDAFRRASLLDGLFAEDGALDALSPWEAARLAIGERPMAHRVQAGPDSLELTLAIVRPDGMPLSLRKSVSVSGAGSQVRVRYGLTWSGAEALGARWGVQLNLALTAGEAPGRYFALPERPSLGGRGRVAGRRGLALVDEWIGCELALDWEAPAEVAWSPVETVSLSEAGFERIYQGTAVLLCWPLRLAPGAAWAQTLTLELRERARA
jgi:alpha-amylase